MAAVPPAPIRSFRHRDFAVDQLLAIKGAHRSRCASRPATRRPPSAPSSTRSTRHWSLEVPARRRAGRDRRPVDRRDRRRWRPSRERRSCRPATCWPTWRRVPGKGQALWKSLHATTSDLVVWCDGDITDFDERFVTGVAGPLLAHPGHRVRQGSLRASGRRRRHRRRPGHRAGGPPPDQPAVPAPGPPRAAAGGRVRRAARRCSSRSRSPAATASSSACSSTCRRYGIESIAQVDLGERHHRNRTLDELGPQAAAILHTACAERPPILSTPPPLSGPASSPVEIDIDEHPPMATVADHVTATRAT
jgi:hypothetical protein